MNMNENQKEELKNEIEKAQSILSKMEKLIEIASDEENKKMAQNNYEMFKKHINHMEGMLLKAT